MGQWSGLSCFYCLFTGSIEEVDEEIEEEVEEGVQSADDKIKAEQAKLEEDKKALQDNHTMMAEVCIHHIQGPFLNAENSCRWLINACESGLEKSQNPHGD